MSREKRVRATIPLRKKAAVFLALIVFIPLAAIALSMYAVYATSMLEKIGYSAAQGFSQSLNYIEYKLYRAIKISDVAVTDKTVLDILGKVNNPGEYLLHEQVADLNVLRNTLQAMEDLGDGIGLALYVDDRLVISQDGSYLRALSQADGTAWYRELQNSSLYFSPAQYLEANVQKVALVRNVVSSRNYRQRLAVLRADIELENLVEILKKASPTASALTLLENSQGVVVASSSEMLLQEYGGAVSLEKKMAEYSNLGLDYGVANGKEVYYLRSAVQNTDWVMTTLIPVADIMRDVNNMQLVIVLLLSVYSAIAIAVGYWAISSLLRSLDTLMESMRQIQGGNLAVHLETTRTDEIGLLYDTYNTMVERTQSLLEETYNMGMELKSAELKALQSQINPHFLYNTLEMINWLGHNNQTEKIHTAVVALAKYYKLTLNKGKDTQTVERELAHASFYIELQSMRYDGAITSIVDVDPALYACVLPKITLQPLVENAIGHGIFAKSSKTGTVSIKGWQENGMAVLSVSDDGAGMAQEEVANILCEKDDDAAGGYAVWNVDARLRLRFGEASGLQYDSTPGAGTTVWFTFPL